MLFTPDESQCCLGPPGYSPRPPPNGKPLRCTAGPHARLLSLAVRPLLECRCRRPLQVASSCKPRAMPGLWRGPGGAGPCHDDAAAPGAASLSVPVGLSAAGLRALVADSGSPSPQSSISFRRCSVSGIGPGAPRSRKFDRVSRARAIARPAAARLSLGPSGSRPSRLSAQGLLGTRHLRE